MDYLQQDAIGGVIAEGLAALYLEKPQFPIDYLAKWLMTYAKNSQIKEQFEKEQKEKQNLLKKYQESQFLAKLQEDQRLKHLDDINRQELLFRDKILTIQYHEELLKEEFCEFLKNFKNFSGVYVCELDYPRKDFSVDQEDDEQAHFDINGQKLLRYVAACQDHQFILDKTLQPETGVTYEALKELPPNEDGVIPENRGVYISDVVKDARIVYHKWPKLGAFYAVQMTFNSSLQENGFDIAVEQRQIYLKNREESKKEKEAKEQEFEELIQQKQENNEDYTQVEQELHAFREQYEEPKETPFQTVKREFVLCVDTLGQDREISEEDRNLVAEFAKLFGECWENREKQTFSEDIDRQLKYIDQIGVNLKDYLESYQQEEDAHVEANSERFEEIKEKSEKEHNYEIECLKLEKLKEQMNDKQFISPLIQLHECRIIKFPGIIQAGLYLLGYNKAEINVPGTNILNWKHVRTLLNESLIDKFINHSHRGPQNQPPYPWSMINRIQKRLERFDQELVDNYNAPYGRLLKLLLMTCRLRKLDIEIRRAKIEQKRQLIQQLKEEVVRIHEDREKTLKAEQEAMAPEDLEMFNQEEWDAIWDQEHPLPEIPENPHDEIDLDYDFEQQ